MLGMWHPSNLCMYVQKLFWAILAIATVLPTVLIGLAAFPTMIYLQIQHDVPLKELWVMYGIGDVLGIYLVIASVTGFIIYALSIIVGVGITVELIKDKRQEAFRAMSVEEQEVSVQPGLLKAWWHAAHDKVCPILEFVRKQ